MTSNLLPCPHCGSNEVEYRRARDNPRAWVLCGNCGAMCDELDTLPEADCITAWNRRAGETIREMAKLYAYSPTCSPAFLHWLDTMTPREGVGANQAWNAGVEWQKAQPASTAPEAVTREAFIAGYIGRSKVTREKFDQYRIALPCDCGAADCEGWAAIKNSAPEVLDHLGFRDEASALMHPPEVIEDMCARIKAADDAAADGGYMLDSKDCISVLRGTWKGPLAMDMPAKPSTVEQAIDALVTALAASKGWMRDYADSVVRDAIDRRVPEAMTDKEIEALYWTTASQYSPMSNHIAVIVAFARKVEVASSQPNTASIYSRQPNPYAMTTAERVAWVKGHNAGWDAAKNGAEAWKDVPRTGDWVADAGGSEVK